MVDDNPSRQALFRSYAADPDCHPSDVLLGKPVGDADLDKGSLVDSKYGGDSRPLCHLVRNVALLDEERSFQTLFQGPLVRSDVAWFLVRKLRLLLLRLSPAGH
jgi:hypothetical protein